MKKRILLIVISVFIFMMSMQCTFAGNSAGAFESKTGITGDPIAVDNEFAGRFFGYFQVAVYIMAVIMILYIGIRYILAAADDKAELKKAFYKYFIGIFLVVAATTIASIIFNLK